MSVRPVPVRRDPFGFALMLRIGIQDQLDQAEHLPFVRRLRHGDVTRDEYGLFLAQIKHLHDAFEPRLRSLIERDETVRGLVREDHFRADRIDGDLRALGTTIGPALVSTRATAAWVATRPLDAPAPLIGVLFAREAASAGASRTARALRAALGPSTPTAFFDSAGSACRTRRQSFEAALDTLPFDERARETAVRAARRAMRAVVDVAREMSAARPEVVVTNGLHGAARG